LFPSYSPDINRPIEKVWRELQRRVFHRAGEIRSRESMVAVVQEEWERLEFGPTAGWCGINSLVADTPEVLREVLSHGGYDTHFMH
jgi:hypothetical protein